MHVIDDNALNQAYRRNHLRPRGGVGVIDCADPAMAEPPTLHSLAQAAASDTALADELLLHLRLRRWAQRAVVPGWRWPAVRELLPAVALATSLAALAVGLWPQRPPPAETPVFRGPEETGLQSTSLGEAPLQLTWPAPPNGNRVQVHLFDADLQPLWSSDWIEGNQLELPSGVREQMRQGSTYYWRLRSDDGYQQHWGPLSRFTIESGDFRPGPAQ